MGTAGGFRSIRPRNSAEPLVSLLGGGILGTLFGAALYGEVSPAPKGNGGTYGNFGKITVPQVLHVNPWIIISAFVLGGLMLFRHLRKIGL